MWLAMPSRDEIEELLKELDRVPADDLESQFLDFKEWDTESRNRAVGLILETVVCLANGGGGTLVVGVRDRRVGRAKAILGVPRKRRRKPVEESHL